MSGLQIKKLWFWSVVFSYSTQQIISQSDCDVPWKADFMWQPAMTSSVAGPRRNSKALPKAKLAPKTGHGHCLVVCCWSDPLQLSESQWNHYIWEVCSVHQSDGLKTATPAARTDQQKGPNSPWWCSATHHATNTSKFEWIGLCSLPHPTIFSWPLANYHFFKHLNFLWRKHFHNQQEAENAFQEFVQSWSMDFTLSE